MPLVETLREPQGERERPFDGAQDKQLVLDDRPPWGVVREPEETPTKRKQRVIFQDRCPRCSGALATGQGVKQCSACGWKKRLRI